MKRRHFLTSTATSVGAALASKGLAEPIVAAPATPSFTPCINQATTMKADFKTAMDAYSKAGFRTVELWLDSVEPFLAKESVATARRVIDDCGLDPRGACWSARRSSSAACRIPRRSGTLFGASSSAAPSWARTVLCSARESLKR